MQHRIRETRFHMTQHQTESFVRALKPSIRTKLHGICCVREKHPAAVCRSCLSNQSFWGRTTGSRQNKCRFCRAAGRTQSKVEGFTEQQRPQRRRQHWHASPEQFTPVALRTVRVVFWGLDLFVSLASRLFATVFGGEL